MILSHKISQNISSCLKFLGKTNYHLVHKCFHIWENSVVLMMELIRSYLRGLKVLIRTWTRMKWRLLWLKKFSTAHFTASWLFLSSSIAIAVIPCFSSTSDKFGRNKAMEDAWKHWENQTTKTRWGNAKVSCPKLSWTERRSQCCIVIYKKEDGFSFLPTQPSGYSVLTKFSKRNDIDDKENKNISQPQPAP